MIGFENSHSSTQLKQEDNL